MNNFKKIGLSALAGSLVMTSVNAVEYSMTGNAKIEFASQDYPQGAESLNGKGIGVNSDLTLNASGELDNGYTVSFTQVFDTDGALSNTSSKGFFNKLCDEHSGLLKISKILSSFFLHLIKVLNDPLFQRKSYNENFLAVCNKEGLNILMYLDDWDYL